MKYEAQHKNLGESERMCIRKAWHLAVSVKFLGCQSAGDQGLGVLVGTGASLMVSTILVAVWDTIIPYRTESVHFFGGL